MLQKPEYAQLLLEVIHTNAVKGYLSLHEYVIMPDHFHLLVTPGEGITLERVMHSSSKADSRSESRSNWDIRERFGRRVSMTIESGVGKSINNCEGIFT